MKTFALMMVLLMSVAETAGARYRLWTAFERDALKTAKFVRTDLENEKGLKVRLEEKASTGTLETAPIPGDFDTAVVSWNALTPTGSSVLIETRARFGTRWSRYYRVAQWSTDPTLPRTSFDGEQDADGKLNTDTLELKRRANALQIRITLTRGSGSPVLTGLAAVLSNSSQHDQLVNVPSSKTAWGTELNVPSRSQMIYPDGGEVWCSPTSVTMILEHWDAKRGSSTAERVPSAARAMWDNEYDGSGNWAFNAAYAGAKGYQAYVTRLSSLADAEAFIARGVPLVLSVAWGMGELDGVHLPKSNGHIVVLRGFTKQGDPIINDPAAKTDAGVRTIYKRAQLERAWITHSGGIVYVIEPR